jgi:electron transport complex protein RnfB
MSNVLLSSIATLGGLGLIFGSGLAYAARKFAVKKDPRVEEVMSVLPNTNCGACGQPGCAGLAAAIVAGDAPTTACIAGGQEVAQKVADVMGVEAGSVEPMVAVVQCRGGRKEAKSVAEYEGIEDCDAAMLVAESFKGCRYGCLGFGTCVRACPFDAMVMNENGLPEIIEEKCTGCGNCVNACPKNIIKLIPRSQRVYLGCVSKDRGKGVKEVCTVGCTGCKLCASPKVTASGAVEIVDNKPEFGPEWSDFEKAVEKCPAGCLVVRKADESKLEH